jgi:drug/metabolite transporter (DMT)-like permease
MWFLYASCAALCFGLRGVFYQWTSQKPINRNLLLFAVYGCGTVVALALNLFMQQNWSRGAWVGIFMGLFSYASNASMYKGFAVGKASLVAIFVALPPVVVIIGAFFLWGETLTMVEIAAFAIILSGILMIRYTNDISLTNLKGSQWALLCMFFFGLTDILTKQATLWEAQTLPPLILMYATGTLLFFLSWLWDNQRKAHSADVAMENSADIPKLWPAFKTIRWGLIIGLSNISGMLFIMPAFKLGVTGLVSTVLAMNVLIIIFYARIFLKEKFSRLEICGIACAITGVVILRLFS